MDTILETNAAVESVRQAYDGKSDRPRPEWVRGTCPQCGGVSVSATATMSAAEGIW